MRIALIYITIIISITFLNSCATTQRMHFSSFSKIDFTLNANNSLLKSNAYSISEVTGGNYMVSGEFADYSWHPYMSGVYQKFVKLPYRDTNMIVKKWMSDILLENQLLSKSQSPITIDVYIKRLKIKSQQDSMFNYRACLVELDLRLLDHKSKATQILTVEGIAKLHDSNISVIDSGIEDKGYSKSSYVKVKFSPDNPAVCKLAIVNALRS